MIQTGGLKASMKYTSVYITGIYAYVFVSYNSKSVLAISARETIIYLLAL